MNFGNDLQLLLWKIYGKLVQFTLTMLSETILSVLSLVSTMILSLMTLSLLTLHIKATGTSPWVFEEVFEDCLAQDKIAVMQ